MSLRIIAGEFGGRRIEAPPGRSTRPTREIVREAWFSVIGDRLPGSRVLDLFAGSGALGLEALSRGAAHVCFVEASPQALAALRRNVRALGVDSRTQVVAGDVFAALGRVARQGSQSWDLVLADPPYGSDAARRLADDFDGSPFADVLCVEHACGLDFAREPDWQRRYGPTALSIFLDPVEGVAHG
ncbi:MAG: 16S rRNA (guanine(966)-N(2))-methyltransferase RsmD [Candidatus Palauibacterales bacterium]|nr:16S rRNA (guanine(966)-N(2))-methyltransferase RsmD [Candidatus Palauibacterales bacterium]